MMYTYEDAAKAVKMILHGIVLLIVCTTYAISTAVVNLFLMIIRNPIKALAAVGCTAAVVAFVPTLVELCWALDSMAH